MERLVVRGEALHVAVELHPSQTAEEVEPIRAMFLEVIIAASAAFVVGVGVSAYRALRTRRVRVARALSAGRRVAIADVPDGAIATVVGTVARHDRDDVEAPFSGERCVYYRLLVEAPARAGKAPDTLLEIGRGIDFRLRDDSGEAVVRVEGADSALAKTSIAYQTVVRNRGDRLLAQVDRGDHQDAALSYFEGRLAEGDEVVVRGRGRWEASSRGTDGGNYRVPPRQLFLVEPLTLGDRGDLRED